MKTILITLVTTILIQLSHIGLVGADPGSEPKPLADSITIININNADEQQLQSLPGIGRAKAKAIIDYRETYGTFNSIEEITLVQGIGNKMFAKIRDRIRV